MKSRDFLGIGVTPIIHYRTKWGWNQALEALIRLSTEVEDQWPPYSRSSCPWGHTVWTTFRGRPHNEDVSLPPASKVVSLWRELYPGLNKEEHCLPVSSNRKNIAWSELNRKPATLKQKNLRLSWKTFLWISLTWTHPDCTETRTHLCSCSTIKSTSELRPTCLTWVPLWTACLLVLIRRIASRWPCLSKAVSQVTLDLGPPRNKRQKEMGFLCILIVFPGAAALI